MSWRCVRTDRGNPSIVEEIGIERAVSLLEPMYYSPGTVNGSMLFGKPFSVVSSGFVYTFTLVEV